MTLPLSYGLAPVYLGHSPPEIALFERLAGALSWLPAPAHAGLSRYLTGESTLVSSFAGSLILALLMGMQSICFLLALRAIARAGWSAQEAAARAFVSIAAGFAACRWLAYPMFTEDMWLSIVWGRMALEGVNPYYELVTASSLTGLPVEPGQVTRMTYGPLWAIVSAAVASFGGTLAPFLTMKTALVAGWLIGLWLVGRTARAVPGCPPALAICLFAWMPLSAHVTVAEGHNDVAMAVLTLLWVRLALSGRHLSAPFALVAAALMKYVAIVLLPLEIWHAWRGGWARRPQYWASLGAALAAAAGIVGIFARDLHFLDETLAMRSWNFLRPADALSNGLTMIGVPIGETTADAVVALICAAILLRSAVAYHRDASAGPFIDLSIATLATVLFAATGHVWPWFLMWMLGLCALRPGGWVALYVLSLAWLMPFVGVFWIRASGWSGIERVTVALYGLAMLQTIGIRILLRRRAGRVRPADA